MTYTENLVNISENLCDNNSMYSLILLSAKSVTMTLSGYRCFLDGKYIVCLNVEDTLTVHSGHYEAMNLCFQPYFYNVNLNHQIIGMGIYTEMREKYGYPDFRLFRIRDNDYFGIIPISDEEYNAAALYYAQAKRDIALHGKDDMWSCRARSDIISVLHIAEGAYLGKQSGLENEVLRYIYDNISEPITLEKLCIKFKTNRTSLAEMIKAQTGMPPMKYILETRLTQSCPDLLFTRLPVNEISEKYGFSDVNYYIRAFKKRFGKTPLQYRKDGVEARIRDEGIYHRRGETDLDEMRVADFCTYYERGLGRAIMKLKRQKNKTPFKEVFLDCMLRQEPYRLLGIYEKEILDSFNDSAFTDAVVQRLLKELSVEVRSAYIPLLILLGQRNEVEKIVEAHYRSSYAQLLEYTKKPWDGEKYPPFSTTYADAARALGRVLKQGDERLKQIMLDLADLYEYTDEPVVPTYQNPLFQIMDGMGRNYFYMVLDEVIREHKYGARIDLRNELHPVPTADDLPHLSKDELAQAILSHDELTKDNWYLLELFRLADKDVIERIAQAALDETDSAKKLYLLHYFSTWRPWQFQSVEFPLDLTPLIQLAREEDFVIPEKPPYGFTLIVLRILANTVSPLSREVALQILSEDRHQRNTRRFALEIRFGKNYIPEKDQSDFVALLRSPDKSDAGFAMEIFRKNISMNIEGLPLDMIPYVFTHIQPGSRREFCELLKEKNLMPEELKEECLCDYDKKTRELYLKN